MRRRNVFRATGIAMLVSKFVFNVIRPDETAVNDIVSMLWNSPSLWGSLSAAAVTYLVLSNWSTIRRLSATVRFVECRQLVDEILAALPPPFEAFGTLMRSDSYPHFKNNVREFKRRMAKFDVRTPGPVNDDSRVVWRTFLTDLLDCMNAKDLKRARKLLDRLGQ